jgi:hypothetical protein
MRSVSELGSAEIPQGFRGRFGGRPSVGDRSGVIRRCRWTRRSTRSRSLDCSKRSVRTSRTFESRIRTRSGRGGSTSRSDMSWAGWSFSCATRPATLSSIEKDVPAYLHYRMQDVRPPSCSRPQASLPTTSSTPARGVVAPTRRTRGWRRSWPLGYPDRLSCDLVHPQRHPRPRAGISSGVSFPPLGRR